MGPSNTPAKTFQWRGKFVAKPEREKAPICACGNKYLKTRRNQKECLRCILNKNRTPVR